MVTEIERKFLIQCNGWLTMAADFIASHSCDNVVRRIR